MLSCFQRKFNSSILENTFHKNLFFIEEAAVTGNFFEFNSPACQYLKKSVFEILLLSLSCYTTFLYRALNADISTLEIKKKKMSQGKSNFLMLNVMRDKT